MTGSVFRPYRALLRSLIVVLQRPFEPYQPLYGLELEGRRALRPCVDRWAAMTRALESTGRSWNGLRVLDVGTSFGFFALSAAAAGAVVDAFDTSRRLVLITQLLARYNGLERRARFCRGTIALDTMPRLIDRGKLAPRYDAVVMLSVLQHVVHARGLDYGRALLQALASRTGCLFLEPGLRSEAHPWAASQAEDPALLVADLFRQGCRVVDHFPPGPRPLFLCSN